MYNVTVDIIDENGNPIPDAKIIQKDIVEFTDNQGIWHKLSQTPELSITAWSQGYLLQNQSLALQPGDNKFQVQLSPDPFGLKVTDLEREGYKLVFVEDFQDNIPDCVIYGNGNVVDDDSNSGNYLLVVDLRNLEDYFSCGFGPTNIENAIIEVDFHYPEIRYTDFKDDDYYNWQGYSVEFRDGFSVNGYPIHVPWGATLQITDFSESEWKFPITMKQNIQEKRWYQLSTKYDGTKVEVRMDGSLKFTFLKPPTMSNTKPSSIRAFGQAYIQFDNVKMWVPIE
jgi:hypothetical protein